MVHQQVKFYQLIPKLRNFMNIISMHSNGATVPVSVRQLISGHIRYIPKFNGYIMYADSRLRRPAMPQTPGEPAPDKQLTRGNVNRRTKTLTYSEPGTYTRRLHALTIAHLIFLFHRHSCRQSIYTDPKKNRARSDYWKRYTEMAET